MNFEIEMEIEDCAAARCGSITASNAQTVLRPGGTSRSKYIAKLLDDEPNPGIFEEGNTAQLKDARGWGHDYEPDARGQFELLMRADHPNWHILPPPLFIHLGLPDVNIGCSPDGMVVGPGEEFLAGIEIKCPFDPKATAKFIAQGLRYIEKHKRPWWLQIQMSSGHPTTKWCQ